jgi:hypothetical protein
MGGGARLVLALVLAPAAVYGLTRVMAEPQTPRAFYLELFAVAAVGVVVTAALALMPVRFMRRAGEGSRGGRVADFAGVVLVFLMGLSVASAHYVPGGSFLVTWPAMFLAVGVIVAAVGWRRSDGDVLDEDANPGRRVRSAPAWGAIVSVVVLVPTVVLWGPLLVQLFTALRMPMAGACCVMVVVAVALVVSAFTPLALAAGAGRGGRSGATRSDPG